MRGLGANMAIALLAGMDIQTRKPRRPITPMPEQIAAADQRTERQKWNDEVAARKAAKLALKGKA